MSSVQMVARVAFASSLTSNLKDSLGLSPLVFYLPASLIRVATNVYFPFRENGFWSAQFVVDPNHWALLCELDSTGLWRVSYGEKDGLTNEEYMERLPAKFEALFPGPKPIAGKYKLQSMSPYRMHQRCADTFRKGRVTLAGDAAHLCNPFGGTIAPLSHLTRFRSRLDRRDSGCWVLVGCV